MSQESPHESILSEISLEDQHKIVTYVQETYGTKWPLPNSFWHSMEKKKVTQKEIKKFI